MSQDHDPSVAADLELGETLDLAAAPSLAASLLALRGRDVTIDASDVKHLAAPCVQVLMSALATWRVDRHRLFFREPSVAFMEGGRLLGVSQILSCEAD